MAPTASNAHSPAVGSARALPGLEPRDRLRSRAGWRSRYLLLAAGVLAPAPAPATARDGAAPGAVTAAAYPLACRYARVELDRYEGCARPDVGGVRIAPAHVARMHFRRGLAEAALDGGGWLWVRRDGLARSVFVLDTGPDPFVQGLARGWRRGKVAFYDRRLRLALATPYDWSHPFNARGAALVCEGCRSDGRQPASMVGGRWGLINRRGLLLTPISDDGAASRRYFGAR